MLKSCRQCTTKFEITDEDLKFYDKVSPVYEGKKYQVPPPTLCPNCRQQRRFTFRNERKLYHRTCGLSGKSVISNYGQHTGIEVYEQQEWWTDKWDAKNFAQEFNFDRPFFEQYNELQMKVPQLALSVWHSENSSYCNYVGNVKNSYLIFGSVYSEDCYYGSPYYSKNCLDTLVVRECENCYQCIDSRKLYECFYCQDCHSSNNLIYCFDLQGCKDCIGCAGLRNKQYYIFNQQVSPKEFQEFKKKLDFCDPQTHQKLKTELEKLKLKIPHRYMQSKNAENVSGNYIYQAKNVTNSFYTDRCEDCRYCAQVVDLKDCYDNNYTEENELCYEYLGAYQVSTTIFSRFCNRISESFYCDSCFNSKNLFGCIGLRNAKYCILNKQYSKEEYEKLVPQIIEHMGGKVQAHGASAQQTKNLASPVLSATELTKKGWGEFFPINISPFCYNESVANEYFPLTKEQVIKMGGTWKDADEINRYEGPQMKPDQNIKKVPDEITKNILTCGECQKNYKIIDPELKFYRKMSLPIPQACPDCRHKARLSMRNPRQLYDRNCSKCNQPIQTTYAPNRLEKILCEKCYLKEVY